MDEQEFFDACSAYVSSIRTPVEKEQRTYMLLELAETEDNFLSGAYIVDPSIILRGEDNPLNRSVRATTILSLKKRIKKIMSECLDHAMGLDKLANILGSSSLLNMFTTANSSEEFQKLLDKALKKKGVELNIEVRDGDLI